MRVRDLPPAATMALALVGATPAEAEWSSPRTLAPATTTGVAGLAVAPDEDGDRRGRATIAWNSGALPTASGGTTPQGFSARVAEDGTSRPRPFAGALLGGPVTASGTSAFAVVGRFSQSEGAPPVATVSLGQQLVRLNRTDRRQPFATANLAGSTPAMAGGRDGTVLVAWIDADLPGGGGGRGPIRERLRAAIRPGRGAPVVLPDLESDLLGTSSPVAAVGPNGRLLVGAVVGGRVRAYTRTASQPRFARSTAVSAATPGAVTLLAAGSSGRGDTLVWRQGTRVMTSSRPQTSSRFTAPVELLDGLPATARPRATIGRDGTVATIAERSRTGLRVALRGPSAGRATADLDPGGTDGAVDLRPDGAVVAAWRTPGADGLAPVRAAQRVAGRWSAPSLVSTSSVGPGAPPAARFLADGSAVVAWADTPGAASATATARFARHPPR